MRQDSAIPFFEAVDAVAMNIPDYFDIVKRPMDLGTVRSKLQRSCYDEPGQVLQDIVQCFDNAIEYNPANEPAHKLAIAIKASFSSLCNGSQVLRPVLRCLGLSGQDVGAGTTKPTGTASSPVKKAGHCAVVEKDGGQKASVPKSDEKCPKDTTAPKPKDSPAPKPIEVLHQEKPAVDVGQAAKRGGPRMAAAASSSSATSQAPDDSDEFRLKIQTKGRAWTSPTADFNQGGHWLIGRHIQVYWDDDKTWFPGVVTFYDCRPTTKDSHGNQGPVHDVYYEDGSFLENLGTATWKYDSKEGPAGKKSRPRRGHNWF